LRYITGVLDELLKNEGKLVLVSGIVTAEGSTVTDPVYEMTVQSPYLERIISYYKYVSYDDDEPGIGQWDKYGMSVRSGYYYKPQKKDAIEKTLDKLFGETSDDYNSGDMSVSFEIIDTAKFGEVTILARQEGNKLTKCEDLDTMQVHEIFVYDVLEGRKNLSQVFSRLDELEVKDKEGNTALLVVAIICDRQGLI
jgi:hypothetical protein